MSVIDKLATSLKRRDEVPNQELAMQIVEMADTAAVRELTANLDNKSKDIQSDCIKTLYEIGARKPSLIAGHLARFIELLNGKDNRLQWGAMKALHFLSAEQPDKIYGALPQLAAAADKGSVITRDHYVGILVNLLRIKKYSDDAFHLLHEQLMTSPVNQLPMYAEQTSPVVPEQHKAIFIKTLAARLDDIESAPKRRRVEKVLKKLGK